MENYALNEMQLSALSEIGNIGAGSAATALSGILSDKVTLSVPELQIIDVGGMAKILGGPENEVAGILVNMRNDVEGMLLFLLERDFVNLMSGVLLEKGIEDFSEISEIDLSAMAEIGNILAGSYVSAISTLTGLDIRLSTPEIAVDMVGAILGYPAAQFGEMGDRLLFIEENFFSGQNRIKSHLLIMPKPDSLDRILKHMGVPEWEA